MQAEPKNGEKCKIAIVPPFQCQTLIKVIVEVRDRSVLHMLPLLLHKFLDSIEGIAFEDDVQDLALDKQFEVNECIDLVAHFFTCLDHRIYVLIGADVVFLV